MNPNGINKQDESNRSFFSPSHLPLRERLITLVALVAIALVTIGILSLINPSCLGPNAQQTLGISSLTGLGGELFLLIVLAYCIHKKRDLDHPKSEIRSETELLFDPTSKEIVIVRDPDNLSPPPPPPKKPPRQNSENFEELRAEGQGNKIPAPPPPPVESRNQPDPQKPSRLNIQGDVRVYEGKSLLKLLEDEKQARAEKMAAIIKIQSRLRMQQAQKWEETLRAIDSDESADEFGSKYDHLVRIQEDLGQVESKPTSRPPYQVPQFFGLKHQQILSLLSPGTQQEWETICLKLQSLSNEERWSDDSRSLIELFKFRVRNDIRKSPLPFSKKQEAEFAQLAGKTLIVRSSSNEDSKTSLNPGGNESKEGIPATKEALKEALAQVVASYFDLESLKNRSLTQDPLQGLPLCSVLIMEQIVEGEKDPVPITSGVMMTHKPSWGPWEKGRMTHVTASWGFGGGIVSGETTSDEWVLTDFPDFQTYSTIRSKPDRFVTTDQGTQKIDNRTFFQTRSSLSNSQLSQLRDAADHLETLFGEPMDVEFVFKNSQLYIVQARSISTSVTSAPAFVDLSQLCSSIPRYRGNVIVSQELSPRKVNHREICFAKNLQEAKKKYAPGATRLVVIHTPESSDTHASLVFSSQDPPIPCLCLSQDDYETCRKQNSGTFNFCPQSGMLVLTKKDLPQRNGLLFHPAQFPISLDCNASVQATSDHPKILELEQLLNRLPEEIGMNHLEAITKALKEIFTEISQREPQTKEMQTISRRLWTQALKEVSAMKRCALEKAYFRLSFHKGVLGKILRQSDEECLGAHSISGLESATHIPQAIQEFMKNHSKNSDLFELAFLGRKAFDIATQAKWLEFLQENRHFSLEQLKEHLKQLDSFGMLTLWFSVHFNPKAKMPNFGTLLDTYQQSQLWNKKCFHFKERARQLTAQVEKIHSDEESTNCWNLLQTFSDEFLQFCSQRTERDPFQQLQISALFVDLVQLWDASIKVSLKSRHEKEIIASRIKQFKTFALDSANSSAIPNSYEATFKELFQQMDHVKSERKEFSVAHWLFPLSPSVTRIEDANQALTVIHQNLLQAAKFGLDYLDLVPTRLADGYELFKKTTSVKAKDAGTYFSLSEKKASIKINIPLNVHSAAITLSQRKGDETLEVAALMRGSDNPRQRHLPFYQAFSELFGISLERSTILAADLEVVFSAKNEDQLTLILRAINQVNLMSTHYQDDFAALTRLLLLQNPNKASAEEKRKAEDRILAVVWKWFKETGEIIIPGCKGDLDAYIEEQELLDEVKQGVFDELKSQPERGLYTQHFGALILEKYPEEGKKAVLENLMGQQTLWFYDIPDSYGKEIFKELILTDSEKAFSYFALSAIYSDLPVLYEEICRELIMAEDPKSAELTSFLERITEKINEKKTEDA